MHSGGGSPFTVKELDGNVRFDTVNQGLISAIIQVKTRGLLTVGRFVRHGLYIGDTRSSEGTVWLAPLDKSQECTVSFSTTVVHWGQPYRRAPQGVWVWVWGFYALSSSGPSSGRQHTVV